MRRYIGIAVGLGLLLVVLAVTNAGPALAQSAIKPVMAFIVNDRANPVPVLVTNTTPAPPDLVRCTLDLGGSEDADGIVAGVGGWSSFSRIQCPAGVTALDVHRVFYAPGVTGVSGVNNVQHWQVLFGLSSSNDTDLDAGDVMAVLTVGAPYTVLSRPVRVDLTQVTTGIAHRKIGSTGIPGIPADMSGSLIFEGVPVP
jgi:hypothetical protein